MCGIAGIVSKSLFSVSEIQKMTDIIKHRGPDDEGFALFNSLSEFPLCLGGPTTPAEAYSSGLSYKPKFSITEDSSLTCKIALGHRRLSILDLSLVGHQPMSYSDDRYWIIFNGEIFNYIEVRSTLIDLGYTFISNTDTEVLLAAYKEWGADCQEKFNGMWAFVIYDRITQEIFMSRDRFGIKPLYYWVSPEGHLCFGSEIKQFTVISGWEAKVNPQRVYDYLFYSLTDHTDETMFKGVYAVPPGCCYITTVEGMQYDKTGRIKTKRWFKPGYKGFKGTFEDASKEFNKLFKSAVNMHIRADVPVGSALSGGLDSSAIVCEMNQILKEKGRVDLQKTFSSCAVNEQFDERKWMEEVVKFTNVDAHFVYPEGKDIFKLTEKILYHQDEPYQSQSAFLGYHVFELARKNGVTVLLNGQGADEYLSGYTEFANFRRLQLLKSLKFSELFSELEGGSILAKTSNLLKVVYPSLPSSITSGFARRTAKYKQLKSMIDLKTLGATEENPNKVMGQGNSIFNIAYRQLLHAPLQKYLRWEDRNSMAHSLEARVPFLDYRLVEFTTQLPVKFLDGFKQVKKLMRHSLADVLPAAIANRQDKKGFITPEEIWFKKEFNKEFIEMFKTNNKHTKGILKEKEILDYLKKVSMGSEKFDYTYWRFISLGIWMKIYNVKL